MPNIWNSLDNMEYISINEIFTKKLKFCVSKKIFNCKNERNTLIYEK